MDITLLNASDILPLCLDLLLEDLLQGHGIRRELGDTLAQLLHSHSLLVEVEAEQSLVVNVALLRDVKAGGTGGIKLLGDSGGRVVEVLEQVGLHASISILIT
jgi:hypothetical protein